MDVLIEFVASNWLQWLFAFCTAALAWLYRGISARLQAEQQKNKAIAAGVEALLRENIVENYHKYLEKGKCPVYAKESIKRVYEAYSNLGGNDVASELYKKLLAMPEIKEAKNEQQNV